ncbi:hypothetical protein JRQ81_003968 [Phrynocephalus forsythii]|uniref:Transmembrane BAX inhibitor motif-containing protein 6 n=1 Tax=Phrynocephalus forsythii TaxID=171643 RepID=A0A9Q1AXP5_9SAUR|nr:hypothetical protein JRQ81_003968 [Phrynocephalus forsythii]
MDVFNRSINFDALFKFSHISASTQQHLKKVYASFALCMSLAAAGAYVNVVTQLVQFGLLTGLGALGLMIWLMATPHSRETEQKRLGMLAGFAFLTGVNLGPLLEMCIAINPSIIPTAFMGTAVIFSCFSLSALYAKRRAYLYLGGILFSGLSLMLFFSLINIFMGSTWLFTANLYIGLMVMCGFVLFDTQLIIEKAENGDKDYIWHCVDLFLDFVNIFRELMVILGMNEVSPHPHLPRVSLLELWLRAPPRPPGWNSNIYWGGGCHPSPFPPAKVGEKPKGRGRIQAATAFLRVACQDLLLA